eukprot:COSAG06_NODE_7980_length_2312_cov_10.301949_5_plen_41_part_00
MAQKKAALSYLGRPGTARTYENGLCIECFPCVCPEPVLAK